MSTLPVAHELTIVRGDKFRHEFVWRRSRADRQNLIGWTADMLVGQPACHTQYQLHTRNGSIMLTRDGRIILSLLPSDTDPMVPGSYPYVLDLTEPLGDPVRFLRGTCHIVSSAS